MAQYVDKSAIVAEIEKRRRDWRYGSSIEAKFKREECDDILSFLDTLEVKEINSTDAFIEKAANFLNYKLFDVVATRVFGTIRPHHVAKQEVIEDFVKFMKGE